MRFPETHTPCFYCVPVLGFAILYIWFYKYLKRDWNSKNLTIPLNEVSMDFKQIYFLLKVNLSWLRM